ncbi:MAG: LD-carboxypeptidase [Nostoc sp.]
MEAAQQSISQLGLKVKLGAHILDRYGYLAGKDTDRADDVNLMFSVRLSCTPPSQFIKTKVVGCSLKKLNQNLLSHQNR